MNQLAHLDSRGGHNRRFVDTTFFKNWSTSMAYVLGFIYADGAIEDVQHSSRTCYLAITSKDLEILEKIKHAIHSTHSIYHVKSRWQSFPLNKRYLVKEQYILRIGSKEIYNDLLVLGLTPRKSLTIILPYIPNEFIIDFIRGYLDGDGCIFLVKNKYLKVIFTSGSVAFINQLSELISNYLSVPLGKVYI